MFSKILLHQYKTQIHSTKAFGPFLKATFCKQTQQKSRSVEADDENPEFYSKGNRQTEADEANPRLANKDSKKSTLKVMIRVLTWSASAVFLYNFYLVKSSDKPESELGAAPGFLDAAIMTNDWIQDKYDFFTKPPIKKLLPDVPNIPGYQHPKTLLLNLSGTVIHTEYVFGKGQINIKRPGLTLFLQKLSTMYECVIFTHDDTHFAQSICEKLDPAHQMFAGRFGYESLVFEGGKYYKDINYFNRNNKKVVVIDIDANRLKQTENGIFLSDFKGDKEDNALYELLPFLEYLARPEIKDVTQELQKYGHVNPGKQFLEEINLKREMIQKKSGMAGMFKGMTSAQSQNRFSKIVKIQSIQKIHDYFQSQKESMTIGIKQYF